MSGLPKSTELHRRIPKQKFYEHMAITPALKRLFIEQINTIYWSHKIAAATMNISAGSTVTEIEVFGIQLNVPELDEAVLRQIDKEIPYHILYLLEFEGKYKACIAYKEISNSSKQAFSVKRYYQTDWMDLNELPIHLEGLTLDAVWENLITQIGGFEIAEGNTLVDQIAVNEERQRIEKEIARLEKLARAEKQPKKKFELVQRIKMLKSKVNNS